MKERPILFNSKMVNAILSGKKLLTRRLITPQPTPHPDKPGKHWWPSKEVRSMVEAEEQLRADDPSWRGLAKACCPIAQVGDRLWVRESIECEIIKGNAVVKYKADGATTGLHPWDYTKSYAPSIHMKKKHARIWVEVTDIRAEKLQDITEIDSQFEGVVAAFSYPNSERIMTTPEYRAGFARIWEETGGKWADNPWVWVIGFKVVRTG
jgi:hypothetical protein